MIKRIYMLASMTALAAMQSFKILALMYGLAHDERTKQFISELESLYNEATDLNNDID